MKKILTALLSALFMQACNDKPKDEASNQADQVAVIAPESEKAEPIKPGPLSEIGNVNLERVIDYAAIDQLTSDELRLLRNEIFARKGYRFKSEDLQNYFEKFPWYVPSTTDTEVLKLDSIERKNIQLIRAVENQYSGPISFLGEDGIYVKRTDKPEIIVEGFDPYLSPDGRKLAYTAASSPALHRVIMIYDLVNGQDRKLQIDDENHFGPVWSNDGKSLAFQIMLDDWTIGVYDQASDSYLTFAHPEHLFSPTWSANSDKIYCHDMTHIFGFDVQGNKLDSVAIYDMISHEKYGISSSTPFYFVGSKVLFTASDYEDENFPSLFEPVSAVFSFETSTQELSRLSPEGLFALGLWVGNNGHIMYSAFTEQDKEPNIYVSDVEGNFVKKEPLKGRWPVGILY